MMPLLSTHSFKFFIQKNLFHQTCSQYKQTSKVMEPVISTYMDKFNEEKDVENKEKLEKGENPYKYFDPTIWRRSCTEEVSQAIDGVKKGEIPNWVTGNLIRNGPGKMQYGETSYKHLFDGSALLHRFQVKDGEVTYQSKFIQSETYKKNMEANRITVSEFGTRAVPDPCQTIFQRFASMFQKDHVTDNANIAVYPLADEYYAYGEYPYIFRINPENLDTMRRVNAFKLFNIVHHTSHPLVTEDGSIFNIGLSTSSGPKYSILTFPKAKNGVKKPDEDVFSEACIVGEVPSRWSMHPGYMHSFGLTENYFIIIEQPLCLSVPTMWTLKLTGGDPCSVLKWYNDQKTLIHVVSRETGKLVKTFHAEAFFYFHTINQYDENGHIFMDVCAYKDGGIIDGLMKDVLAGVQDDLEFAKKFRVRPVRFVLPLNTEDSPEGENLIKLENTTAKAWLADGEVQVTAEILSELSCELPRVNNPKYTGKKYRYFYGASFDMDSTRAGGVVKVDTVNKTDKIWYEEGKFASEPVFVPAPHAKEEDDGVVLVSLLGIGDKDKEITLLVLDGKTFEEKGRVEFKTPSPIPSTFHGWFCPDSSNVIG